MIRIRQATTADTAAVIPDTDALITNGIPLGTALAFMIATVGLSLPEAAMLRNVMTWRLCGIFFGTVTSSSSSPATSSTSFSEPTAPPPVPARKKQHSPGNCQYGIFSLARGYYGDTMWNVRISHMNEDKEMKEWKLAQLFKLQAELATFGCKCVPVWNEELTAEKVKIEQAEGASLSLAQKYAMMWHSAREGCVSIIEGATPETREQCSWLLDKRFTLRKELEEYGKKVLPELAVALGGDSSMLGIIDSQWRETWQKALSLVSVG